MQDPALHSPTDVQTVSIGAGRPPVPAKLVQKIESGVFVEMAELLPERLGVLCMMTTQSRGQRSGPFRY